MFYDGNMDWFLYCDGGVKLKKVTIAICDMQEAYRERLADYLIRKKSKEAQISVFSVRRRFTERQKEQPFDIVLWGKGFEALKEQEASDSLYIFLSDSPELEECGAAIFKYQSAEEIWREIFGFYMELGKKNAFISRKEKEIIGIYSPTHSRLQTPFALTMAQLLSAEKRTLYVNLGEWAGFDSWLEKDYHRDLADLMYLISDRGVKIRGMLESVVHTVNRLDYIPPMTDAQLLCETSAEDYRSLLRLLAQKTDYEVILLDFGVMIPGFFSLLEQCTSIYGVMDEGWMARSQCMQFEESMVKGNLVRLAEKMVAVAFTSADAGLLEQEPVMQQWLYGTLGDRARAARYGQHGAN